MSRVFLTKLDQIQPSQLFINSEKLSQVMADSNALAVESVEPISIKKLGKEVIFTDGHTRAVAACLYGMTEVPVYWDEDELDWEAYGICVKWCKEERIYTIGDLRDRVISSEEYEVLWLKRCKAMHQDLAAKRSQREGGKHIDKR